ncbi:MAG: T9SS type A sorting domain-containing protein [Bacteroidia bacterium]
MYRALIGGLLLAQNWVLYDSKGQTYHLLAQGGKLWMATQKGLYRWDTASGQWDLQAFEGQPVRSLYPTSQNEWWMVVKDQVYVYDGNQFLPFPLSWGKATDVVKDRYRDSLWIATRDTGLWLYSQGNFTNYSAPSVPGAKNTIARVLLDNQGNLVMAYGGNVGYWDHSHGTFNASGWSSYALGPQIRHPSTKGFVGDKTFFYYVGPGGIWRGREYPTPYAATYTKANLSFLPGYAVSCGAPDTQAGCIWAAYLPYWDGTAYVGGGLARLCFNGWTLSMLEVLPLPFKASAVVRDTLGIVWASDERGALCRYTGEWTCYPLGLPGDVILGVTRWKGDTLATVTDRGTAFWINGTWLWDTTWSFSLYAWKAHGGTLWGAGDSFIVKRSTGWKVFRWDTLGLPSPHIRDIAVTTSGVWMAMLPWWNGLDWQGGGLAFFDGMNVTVYDSSNSPLPDNRIYALSLEPSGAIWLGTVGAVCRFDGSQWQVYNNLGFNPRSLYYASDENALYVGTDVLGLWKFEAGQWYNSLALGAPFLSQSTVLSVAKTQTGVLWVGLWDGAARWDGRQWSFYNGTNSLLPSYPVGCMAAVGDSMYLGTWGGGLAVSWGNLSTSSPLPSKSAPLVLYPNPASDYVRMRVVLPQTGWYECRILDLWGKVVYQNTQLLTAGENMLALDLQNISAGLYVVRLRGEVDFQQQALLLVTK